MKTKAMNRAIFTGWAMLVAAIIGSASGCAVGLCLGLFLDGKIETGRKAAYVEMRQEQPIQNVSIAGAGDEGYRRSW